MAVLEGRQWKRDDDENEGKRHKRHCVFHVCVCFKQGVCIYLQYRSLDSTSYKLTVYLEKDKF